MHRAPDIGYLYKKPRSIIATPVAENSQPRPCDSHRFVHLDVIANIEANIDGLRLLYTQASIFKLMVYTKLDINSISIIKLYFKIWQGLFDILLSIYYIWD